MSAILTDLEKQIACLIRAVSESHTQDTREYKVIERLLPYCPNVMFNDSLVRLNTSTSTADVAFQAQAIEDYYNDNKEYWLSIVKEWVKE